MANHNWTDKDDIVAYYLYRYGLDSLLFDIKSICKKMGMTPDSMKARIGNFKFLEEGEGLSHVAERSHKIFNEYKRKLRSDHFEKVKQILY